MLRCQRCGGAVATIATEDNEADYVYESTCMSCGEMSYSGTRRPGTGYLDEPIGSKVHDPDGRSSPARRAQQRDQARAYWARRHARERDQHEQLRRQG